MNQIRLLHTRCSTCSLFLFRWAMALVLYVKWNYLVYYFLQFFLFLWNEKSEHCTALHCTGVVRLSATWWTFKCSDKWDFAAQLIANQSSSYRKPGSDFTANLTADLRTTVAKIVACAITQLSWVWCRTTVDQCSKNATKMKPVSHQNATRQQPVDAIVQTVAEPFLYFLKSVENPPYIRFTVPGNAHSNDLQHRHIWTL